MQSDKSVALRVRVNNGKLTSTFHQGQRPAPHKVRMYECNLYFLGSFKRVLGIPGASMYTLLDQLVLLQLLSQ